MDQQVYSCTISHKENKNRLVAVKGVLKQNGKILLIQRAEGDTLGGLYEFPGGGVEEGEDLLNALRRELLEEIGFQDIVNINYFSCIDIPSKKIHLVFYFVLSDETPSILEDQTDLVWVEGFPSSLSLTPETEKILLKLFTS